MSIHMGFLESRKPIIKNVDGGFSAEDMVTVRVGAEWMNVPTMFGGKRVTEEQAIDILQAHNWADPETGRAVERFDSWGGAQKSLLKRRLEVVDEILRRF